MKQSEKLISTIIECAEQLKEMGVKMEKYVPKKGDFIYNEWSNECYIDIYKNEKDFFASFRISIKSITVTPSSVPYSSCSNIRPATEEEKKLLLNALHKEGKDWDFEKMEIVDYRWRAEKGGLYWYYDAGFEELDYSTEIFDSVDLKRYNCGNYFKTEAEAEAYREYCLAYKK